MSDPAPSNPRCPACGGYVTGSNAGSRWSLIGGGLIALPWTGCLGLFIGAFVGGLAGAATVGMVAGLAMGVGVPLLMSVSGMAARKGLECRTCGHTWQPDS